LFIFGGRLEEQKIVEEPCEVVGITELIIAQLD
jgi:hypothetical protein